MSRIDELIEQLCPNGVEFRSCKKAFEAIPAPKKIKRQDYGRGTTFPIIDQGQSRIAGYTDDANALLPLGEYVLFGDHTRIVKYVDHAFAQGADGLKILRPSSDIMPRYAYHAVASLQVPSRGYNRHWTELAKLFIPIPPMEIQKEVVRILDSFTTLEAELEAELEARNIQFSYYRDKLFAHSRSIAGEVKKLSEISEIRGRIGFRGYTRADMVSEGEGAISLSPGDINDGFLHFENCSYVSWDKYFESPEIMIEQGDVLFVKTGSTVGKATRVEYLPEKATINPQLVVFKRLSDKCLQRYLMYYLQTSPVQTRVRELAGIGSVPNISQKKLGEIEIPLPPIEEQRRVVSILDSFDVLVHDVSNGLPAEAKARQSQYASYRNRLLSFREKVV